MRQKQLLLPSLLLLVLFISSIVYRSPFLNAAPQDAIVGDGTPTSCDNNTLSAALANGGTITFDCGPDAHIILADTYVIDIDTVVDGANLITLDGENLRQIFLVQEGASLTLQNISLQHGYATTGPGGAIWNFGTLLIQNSTLRENGTDTVWAGGALANDSTGTMNIENSLIESNSAADAAAIYTRGLAVTITNSTIRNNFTRDNGGFYGGGAILQEITTEGVVTIQGSTIEGNLSNPNGSVGGAISLLTGNLLIEDSILSGNFGYGGGGAIFTSQGTSASIQNSRIVDNQTLPADGESTYPGGAIYSQGILQIDQSTISGNQATDGGGIFSGVANSSGEGSSLHVTRSTISGNRATGGGGGLLLFPGEIVVENSTISGNSAAIGGGIRSGLTAGLGSVRLNNTTLYGNSATTDGANLYVDDGSEPVSVSQSVLGGAQQVPNCYAGAPLNSGGYNLVDDDSCALTATGDQQDIAPLLGPLADNGGQTETHLPDAVSPLIDAALGTCPATDQRGILRPAGTACDIGAVEVEIPPTPTLEPTVGPTATVTPAPSQLQLSVDVAAERKPISDNIYGLHYSVDADFAREIALPLRRWGGNDKSRYNWEINATNHGVDWYYHNNLAFDAVTGNELSADQWIAQNKATDTESLITLPLTGYVAKDRAQNTCGYSVAKYGPQDDIDDEDGFPDCGNGLLNGLPIQGDPLDTSIAIDEGFVGAWVQHLQDQAATNGPVTFYGLDNEPDIWFETHHDIAPKGWTYDEFRELTIRYAAAVKAADPNAQVVGPVISSWTYYWHGAYDGQRQDWETPDDRDAHGGTPFVPWYLQQMQAYETAQGKRLLDYLDLHFYPQNGVALRDAGDANLQALRLRSTRALWDPTYVDESWIKDAGPDGGIVRLIPRMQAWVDQNYPGTKLAITEYNWGALDHINGGLAQADILGIFGQEGVGLATLFDTPYRTGLFTPSSPGAFAFRIYRNYDGAGSRFGETSVHATSSNRESLAIYAAERASDGAVTLVVINKSGAAQTADLTIANLPNGAEPNTAQLYRYSDANVAAIEHLADQPIANGKLVLTYPANSISVLVVPRETMGTITPTPLPTSTPTITPTPTAIGTATPAATLVPINLAFNLPPIASIKKVNYPLNIVEVIDTELNLSITRRVIDLEICLYRKDLSSSISPMRLPYEKVIQYFADGIYEMTNGAHIIREVTIFHNCTDLSTDVVWVANAWPEAPLSGFGNDLGAHVIMADTFPFPTPYAALRAGNERGTGYTLAHEWGHYMYGMGDQYANTAVDAMGSPTVPCNTANTYQGPCFSDLPVSPSAMSSQWNATGGDYTWLNFSIAANETRRNTHWRLYQADNWTTLTRSADNDPQAIYTNRAVLRRNFFPELRFAAPQGTAAPRIDLPASSDALATGAARAKLKITWRDRNGSGNGLPSYKPNLDPFHYCLSCPVRLGWENRFIYPDAAIFNVRLEKELPIANMNVFAQVTSPEGAIVDVPMQDAEGIGNYQAVLPYSSGGEHQITFRFTNPNNAAILTNAGATYTVGPNGENAPLIEEPVNQPFTITASTVFTISNFAVDDHGNTLADATVLTTTNESTGGRIDQPGDVDFFTFSADRSGDLAVRVTDLALGMEPKLTIAQENGDVIFEQAWNATMETYLFARFPVQIGDLITISVTDARPTAQGGHYRISAGEPLAAEAELDKGDQIYLPFVQK